MSLAAGEAPVDAPGPSAAGDLRWRELPAAAADPLAAFAAAPASGGRFCWIQPERDLAIVGLGATLRWRPASQESRFTEAARFCGEVARWFGGPAGIPPAARAGHASGGLPAGPILCGGFAFDSEPGVGQSRWSGFDAGMLVLPELLGIAAGGTLRWLVTAPAERLAEASRRSLQLLRSASESDPRPCPLALIGSSGTAGDDEYSATIAAALARIRAGAFGKVVPARQVTLRLAGAPGAAAAVELLRRLAAGYPTATTFAVSSGNRTLLGATPELLVRTGYGVVEADALAGSCARGESAAADSASAAAMLANRKERREHEIVVHHLRRGLAAAGVSLDPPPAVPHVRSLPGIQHLCTPLRGRFGVAAGTIFELAEALHPTPAVAGQPVAAALEFLRRHEPASRGWFAGPVGWTDLTGNGELCMALRSGLLDPDSNEISLFAGSGVVDGSDPVAELRETAAKLEALPAVTDDAPLGRVLAQ
ncbi:MAG: isochorismate synthase [bacterium]|nr:isochorismate synthase [bacterium]